MRRLIARLHCAIAGHAASTTRNHDVRLSSSAPLKLVVSRCGRCKKPLETKTYASAAYPLRRA